MYLFLFRRGKELMPRREDGSICYSDTHYRDTWVAMESLVDKGLVRAIGLSNFNARQTADIISMARHRPVVNQVECHPYLSQADLLSYCQYVKRGFLRAKLYQMSLTARAAVVQVSVRVCDGLQSSGQWRQTLGLC